MLEAAFGRLANELTVVVCHGVRVCGGGAHGALNRWPVDHFKRSKLSCHLCAKLCMHMYVNSQILIDWSEVTRT